MQEYFCLNFSSVFVPLLVGYSGSMRTSFSLIHSTVFYNQHCDQIKPCETRITLKARLRFGFSFLGLVLGPWKYFSPAPFQDKVNCSRAVVGRFYSIKYETQQITSSRAPEPSRITRSNNLKAEIQH